MIDPIKQFQPPDFQANTDLPSWLPMGEQSQSLDMSPFVSALKKRMSGNEMMKGGEMGSMGKAASGGGVQSL